MLLRNSILAFLLFIGGLTTHSTAQSKEFVQSYDLSDDWLIYDADYENFVPYVASIHNQNKAHSLVIDKQKFGEYILYLRSEVDGQYLFIEGSLAQQMNKSDVFTKKVKSLGTKGSRIVEVSIFGSNDLKDKVAQLGYYQDETPELVTITAANVLSMKRRNLPISQNMTLMGFLFTFFSAVLISTSYPRAFRNFLDYGGLFRSKIREAAIFINNPFGRTNLTFLVFLSFITAFLIWLANENTTERTVLDRILIEDSSNTTTFINYFIVLSLSLFLYLAKLILMRVVGGVFGIGKLVDFHFFKLLQVTLCILLPFTVMAYTYSFTSHGVSMDYSKITYYLAIGFYAFRMIVMLFTLNKNSSIQIHYIIPYLCIVELLPLLLGLRFIF